MINWFLNFFRKNKIYTFKPYDWASGPHPALAEFMCYKRDYEEASGKKIRLVKAYSVLGIQRIDFIEEQKNDD